MSLRSYNPACFEGADTGWFLPWYRILAKSRRVQLLANSEAVARSYAEWIDLPHSDIRVIRNGINPSDFPDPAPQEKAAFRLGLGMDADTPLVAGVFRLGPEKRPLDFLRVVRQARAAEPRIRAVLAGRGSLEASVRHAVRQLDLQDCVTLLGRRSDIPLVIGSSDVVLHSAEVEGCPNVLLEAQWLEKPVVANNVAGIPEAVLDGESGFLHPLEDTAGMAKSLLRLLSDEPLRRRMGARGKAWVASRFSMDETARATLQLYADALSDPSRLPGLEHEHRP